MLKKHALSLPKGLPSSSRASGRSRGDMKVNRPGDCRRPQLVSRRAYYEYNNEQIRT
jgi:hypothetical protein